MNVMMLREAVGLEDGVRRFVPPMEKVASALAEALAAKLAASNIPSAGRT